ncbi:uncharacterized protein VTP21DRAFT_3574 [Calcarisporiella thermophila]|uniref:uncharacterized protein n=1 Tax=Calcarisporiella thermophila TaxID=911321 RepID=UPI00374329E8
MPKYYCDYCDIFLTHDSPSVRKSHNHGKKHLENVRNYYAELGQEETQEIIDQITKAYENSGGAVLPPQYSGVPVFPGMMFPYGGGGGGAPYYSRPPFGGPMPPSGGPPPGMHGPPPGMPPYGGGPPGGPPGPPPPGFQPHSGGGRPPAGHSQPPWMRQGGRQPPPQSR